MKYLAALLSLTLFASTAIAQDDPDIEVYLPVASQAPVPEGVVSFDADWTANRKLAMAYVEDYGMAHKLVLATFDPASGAFTKLGEIMAKPWKLPEVSLAVPPKWFGDAKLDRIYVAASIESPVQGFPGKVARGVRLFSAPIDGPAGKLSLATIKNLPETATTTAAEPPHAQVSVLPFGNDYVVDLAFIDPNSQVYSPTPVLGFDGQVMLARSYDHGVTCYAMHVTGAFAANCNELKKLMGVTRFGRLAVAAEESEGRTLIAVEDLENDVIHVLHGLADEKHMEWFASTPTGDFRPEFAPRIASEEGLFNVTCLTGVKGSKNGNQLIWFSGRLNGKLQELQSIYPNTATEADIEVRDGKAYIIARCFPDNGGDAVPMVFEDQRNDPFRFLTAVPIADDGLSMGVPRAALTPEGLAKIPSYLFQRPEDVSSKEGVRLDP